MAIRVKHLKFAIAAVILSYLAFTLAIVAASWPIDNWSLASAEQFGDSFGSINSFFAAVSTILIVATIVVQQHELAMQREELKLQRDELFRLVGSQQRQIHNDLLRYAIDDDELAAVWDADISDHSTMRQYIYVNMIVSWWQEMYAKELLREEDLKSLLDKFLTSSRHFRAYWEMSRRQAPERRTATGRDARFVELVQEAYERGVSSEE